jgi:hypothetical protein
MVMVLAAVVLALHPKTPAHAMVAEARSAVQVSVLAEKHSISPGHQKPSTLLTTQVAHVAYVPLTSD